MRFAKLLAIISVVAFAGTSNAGGKESLHDKLTGQSYGMAGCGLGSIVFGDDPSKGVQIVSELLNATGGQTFAITSGTSNCGASGNKSARASEFIDANKVALESDVARGQGETISTLSDILGCQNKTFGSQLQQNYKNIFSDKQADKISSEVMKSCEISG